MNRRVLPLTIGSLLLVVGWGCRRDSTGPIIPFCSVEAGTAIAEFEDANLEAAIRDGLSASPQTDLSCGLLKALTNLSAEHSEIASLAGIENLTNLTFLWIRGNSITDLRPLAGLRSLTFLNLAANSITDISALSKLRNLTFLAINDNGGITDISALSGLTSLSGTLWMGGNSITDLSALSRLTNLTGLNAWENSITDLGSLIELTNLTTLHAWDNSITDISTLSGLTSLNRVYLQNNPNLSDVRPLLDNPTFGAGARMNLSSTNVSCTDVAALQAKLVVVISDCP